MILKRYFCEEDFQSMPQKARRPTPSKGIPHKLAKRDSNKTPWRD